MKRMTLLLFLFAASLSAQTYTSSNVLQNGSFETSVDLVSDYEASSVGKWSFFVCADNGSVGTITQSSSGFLGKCAEVSLSNLISNNVWSSSLYQDVQLLRPTKYELLLYVKGGVTGNSAVNVSAIDRRTNQVLIAKEESGFRYIADQWQPRISYLDFSNFTSEQLANVRLSIHFSEAGIFAIDEMSFRPLYEVPFSTSMTDYFSFDLPTHDGFVSSWNPVFSTVSQLSTPAKVGGTNNATMRYTIYPERGAQPIEGTKSLFVEVCAITGSPSYEIKIETPSIAKEADGKKIRLSFWAKASAAYESYKRISIVPRFSSSSASVVQLTSDWVKYSMDFNLASITYPEYRFFRFQFDKVCDYHLDALMLEYIDIPAPPTGISDPRTSLLPLFVNQQNGVQIENKQGVQIHLFTIAGEQLRSTTKESSSEFVELNKGAYLAKWKDNDGFSRGQIVLVK